MRQVPASGPGSLREQDDKVKTSSNGNNLQIDFVMLAVQSVSCTLLMVAPIGVVGAGHFQLIVIGL